MFFKNIDWLLIAELTYLGILIIVCLRIIYDTRTSTKTLAYLLFAVFVPVIGMISYFFLGINYRKRNLYSKKLLADDTLQQKMEAEIQKSTEEILAANPPEIKKNRELACLLLKDNMSPLTDSNRVKLLFNGEEKFPEVLEALKQAKNHIHIEYYIFEDDEIGNQIKEILIQKAAEGVEVRLIYDDFGSSSIRRKFVPGLIENGVEAYPFYRVLFLLFANRLNYRNHRKIIIVDGHTAFVGGINISDRYINNGNKKNRIYWRDTHLRIDGAGCQYLQYLFLCDWNFCSDQQLQPTKMFFPKPKTYETDTLVQIAAGGPDSKTPGILFSLLQAINLAKKEILITTPYFIPGDSLLDALIVAALSGVSVKLLVPGISDSRFVNAAAHSYYDDLLDAGVEIYFYKKGFIHAKTLVYDGAVAAVGTANMDYRSFELNFEVNAFIYDPHIAKQLTKAFYDDLEHAERIDIVRWEKRAFLKVMFEKTARMLSPLL
ncbi:cardiolipin synthase [Danxiaibacter flavus]|uniref:Cardiolipin synthase n=1 Tax=Danxiaibacter flavus TaxID=3049108 RepID=A0ABV3ZKH9_9BACT|nr:cardiolipin synthase [Chitinophagaceae bacterium DXS]